MFEKRHQPLASKHKFAKRLIRCIVFGWIAIAIALYIGMLGYHVFEKMPWIDAFANASMILSGMGPFAPLTTTEGKLFAGFYALFSGLAFILIMAVTFAPVFHRFLHKFHLDNSHEK
jgi:hypothetical protein